MARLDLPRTFVCACLLSLWLDIDRSCNGSSEWIDLFLLDMLLVLFFCFIFDIVEVSSILLCAAVKVLLVGVLQILKNQYTGLLDH